MTDAHCHVLTGAGRHFVCREPGEGAADCVAGRDFLFRGIHPWQVLAVPDPNRFREERLLPFVAEMRRAFAAEAENCPCGIGEIGLDRLKERAISPLMRDTFEAQLALAAEVGRPVVLHGAKCWGEVVKACRSRAAHIPAFLFHGFSRSGGLIPDIVGLNGYISVGPAVLNDHAVNYRELVKAIPLDRLLVETDATAENAADMPSVETIATKAAALRGIPSEELAFRLESNADAFIQRR